jgi:flagellar biosynthesis anti-sigma factor FlgM
MRIDSNQAAQSLPESGPADSPKPTSSEAGSATNSALGEDEANFSGAPAQLQALAQRALQFPEIREEKVGALRQAVLGGNYQPSSKQLADAVFAHLLAASTAA